MPLKNKRMKEVIVKKMFNAEEVLPEQIVNNRGKADKEHCMIKSGETYYKVRHSFNHILEMISPIEVKGFRRIK